MQNWSCCSTRCLKHIQQDSNCLYAQDVSMIPQYLLIKEAKLWWWFLHTVDSLPGTPWGTYLEKSELNVISQSVKHCLHLKTLDTKLAIVKDQSSHMVYLNMHKITNLWKLEINLLSKLRDNNGWKNTPVTRSCVLSDALFRELKKSYSEVSKSNSWKITSFSHNVLYYQQLPSSRKFLF